MSRRLPGVLVDDGIITVTANNWIQLAENFLFLQDEG